MAERRRGLTIVVADTAPDRFRCALNLALVQAALGGAARLFLDGAAVSLLCRSAIDREPAPDAGWPKLAALHDEALDAGVRVILCQSGLATIGADLSDYDPRIEAGGMVSLLQTLGEDRLVVV